MTDRASWDSYFMALARQVATRATCDRKHVGAVIVRDRTVLSTGYNGSLPGRPHCDDVGHELVDGHCVATVHAETNAVAQAARTGVRIDGATCYTTASPCWPCYRLLVSAGVVRVVFDEFYGKDWPSTAGVGSTVFERLSEPPKPAKPTKMWSDDGWRAFKAAAERLWATKDEE